MSSSVRFTNGIDKMMELFGFSKVVCEHKPASKCFTVIVLQSDLKISPAFVILLLKFMLVHYFSVYDGVEICFWQMYLVQKWSELESNPVGKTKMETNYMHGVQRGLNVILKNLFYTLV